MTTVIRYIIKLMNEKTYIIDFVKLRLYNKLQYHSVNGREMGTGLSRDKNLRVNKNAGYKFVKKDKSVNKRAGLHDKKTNIANNKFYRRRQVRNHLPPSAPLRYNYLNLQHKVLPV